MPDYLKLVHDADWEIPSDTPAEELLDMAIAIVEGGDPVPVDLQGRLLAAGYDISQFDL